MTAVQRDVRLDFWRRAFSRWRRAAKDSASSASSLGAVLPSANVVVVDRRHQRRRIGDRQASGYRRPDRDVLRRRRRAAPDRYCGCASSNGRGGGIGSGGRRKVVGRLGAESSIGGAARSAAVALAAGVRPAPALVGPIALRLRRSRRRRRPIHVAVSDFGGAGEPGRFAARATHGAAGRPDRGRVDHVGRGAVRTDNQHGGFVASTLLSVPKTYQPTVNGPETMAGLGEIGLVPAIPALCLWRRCDIPVKARFLTACSRPELAPSWRSGGGSRSLDASGRFSGS